MPVIFPDVEALVVSHLVASYAERNIDVRVGTKKTKPGQEQPAKEVVVTCNYSGTLDPVRSEATLTLDVYASAYADATELALITGAIIVTIPGEHVKRAVVTLGPVRLSDEAPLEKRSLSVDLIVKGSTL